MRPAHQPAPWHEHRSLAENVGQSVADALSNTIGSHVELGIATSCDPDEMLTGRPMPVRATLVRMERPLRDVMIFVSSLKSEFVLPLVEVAAKTAIKALGVPTGSDEHGALGEFLIEDAIEYETLEEALEQCDALYLEAVYSLELPTGELQMVLGSGMLESASFLQRGEVDPFAVGAPYVPAGAELPAVVDEPVEAAPAAAAAAVAPATPQPVGAIEALDAALATEAVAAMPAAAAAPAAAPMSLSDVSATRWTDLLSSVDVELSAELGRADLPLGEITSLDGESVLTLDQLVHEPVTVYVNGTPYATARLVVVDGEYGIEILEVVDQAGLVSSLAA
jgi:flagellar motor switch protein FliN/FliY